jgi:hypothetical protein
MPSIRGCFFDHGFMPEEYCATRRVLSLSAIKAHQLYAHFIGNVPVLWSLPFVLQIFYSRYFFSKKPFGLNPHQGRCLPPRLSKFIYSTRNSFYYH